MFVVKWRAGIYLYFVKITLNYLHIYYVKKARDFERKKGKFWVEGPLKIRLFFSQNAKNLRTVEPYFFGKVKNIWASDRFCWFLKTKKRVIKLRIGGWFIDSRHIFSLSFFIRCLFAYMIVWFSLSFVICLLVFFLFFFVCLFVSVSWFAFPRSK